MPEMLPIDSELAARADALFRELGLDLPTAVQLFLRQSLREHGLPFTPRLTPPSPRHSPASPAPPPSPGEDASASLKTASPSEDEARASAAESENEDARSKENHGMNDEADFSGEEKKEPAEEACPAEDETSDQPSRSDAISPESDAHATDEGGELRQAFRNARLIGASLRRVRSLNRLYSIGEPNAQVHGWREVYVSGDEPFALDFGAVRVELGFHGGGSLRMMDGRLPDSVLEADAVYPRDLSAVFSSVIGQRLVDVASSRIWNEGQEREQLCLRFANGCTLNFAPGGDWGALWLTDVHGSVMFAPEAVWLRVLDDRTRSSLR